MIRQKLDEIKVAYSTLYGTTEFTLALARNFVNIQMRVNQTISKMSP